MDVQTGGLGHAPFDLVVSQLGVMFFDEPLVAFGAIRTLLGPDGRLVFACWQGVELNPWHLSTSLRGLVPPPPLPPPGKSPVGPFTLGDDEYVRDILGGAGFAEVESVRSRDHGPGSRQRRGGSLVAPVHGRRARGSGGGGGPGRRHLERFAVGPDEYEYPLAFRVYEAVNG